MTTPAFVRELRRSIGHSPLWLSGITAYVRDDEGRVLLGRRADTGEWALVYGIIEPGEQPADTVFREVREETGVDVEVVALVAVSSSSRLVTYPNGDQARYLNVSFLCRPRLGGNNRPSVSDDENLEVGWFRQDSLPNPLAGSTARRMREVEDWLDRAEGPDHDARTLFSAH
ncbi:NUDIX domain-containing protein [uncultured Bifidobacterium sp.]|uniref:NUDIX hydrolase n=1 Tax=uncultured Bifidobacterium sp. TaxID=165187 RepID=UPI0028DCF5D8|nr:NUDIX domain-containing protein [uncultured Bifidobacterium sp.]